MSEKIYDGQGRWRSKSVGFHMSPEEKELLDATVRVSGLSKQDYIISKLLNREIVIQGNPKIFISLKREMERIIAELERMSLGETVSFEILETIKLISTVMEGMKEESDWRCDT